MRALGIDVGVRKGLDLVLLDESRSVLTVRSHVAVGDLPPVIAELKPNAIAIDSPPGFANGRPRETENAVRQRGISLYATPWQEEKKLHPFYHWMRVGFAVFESCAAAGFPLFANAGYEGSAMEVFPYASAVVLSGALRPSTVRKKLWRRSMLESHGIDVVMLNSIDSIDAGLAALTGLMALEGRACWEGEHTEGVIILPCRKEDLKQRYTAP